MTAPNHWGKGREIEPCDPEPAEMPLGAARPETLETIVARMLHAERMAESSQGHESWDEANDFALDDPDTLLDFSPYEIQDMLPEADPGYTQLDPEPATAEATPVAENSSPVEAPPDAGKPDSSTQANQ